MKRIAIYPGTFDPLTNGHFDIVKRTASLFDQLIIAIAESKRKMPYFDLQQRLAMCHKVFANNKKIKVLSFSNLIIDFAKKHKATFIIKGLRTAADFDYEFHMAGMNHQMAPQIETLFLPAGEYSFISATMVREILSMGGDISEFVPKQVAEYIKKNQVL